MLTCKKCGQEKPFAAFWKQNTKRGYFVECKPCSRARNREWVDKNRDRFRHLNKNSTQNMRRRDPVRAMLNLARARSKKQGIEFDLEYDDLVIPSHCPVLGIPLSFGLGMGMGMGLKERDGRASLDRVDNNRGYVKNNVVVVSYRANRLKSDADVSELLKVARFYANLSIKNGKA